MAFNLPPGCGRMPGEEMESPPLAYTCGNCGAVIGDLTESRLISVSREETSDPPHASGYVHVAECPDCGYRKRFYGESEDPLGGFGEPLAPDAHETAIASATGGCVLEVASSWAEIPEFARGVGSRYPWQLAEVGSPIGDGAFEPETAWWVLVPMENWKLRHDLIRPVGTSAPPDVCETYYIRRADAEDWAAIARIREALRELAEFSEAPEWFYKTVVDRLDEIRAIAERRLREADK